MGENVDSEARERLEGLEARIIDALRTQVKEEPGSLRKELREEIQKEGALVRSEMNQLFHAMSGAFAELRLEMLDMIRETRRT